MKYGVVLPQTEIGDDPEALRHYAQAVEELGYEYILAYDHVLGADTSHYKNWTGDTGNISERRSPGERKSLSRPIGNSFGRSLNVSGQKESLDSNMGFWNVL